LAFCSLPEYACRGAARVLVRGVRGAARGRARRRGRGRRRRLGLERRRLQHRRGGEHALRSGRQRLGLDERRACLGRGRRAADVVADGRCRRLLQLGRVALGAGSNRRERGLARGAVAQAELFHVRCHRERGAICAG
jgi:hypothetical protein